MKLVRVDEIRGEPVLAREILDWDGKVLLAEGVRLRPQYRRRLLELGIEEVYVLEPETGQKEYDTAHRRRPVDATPDPAPPRPAPYILDEGTRGRAMKAVAAAMDDVRLGRAVDEAEARATVQMIMDEVLAHQNAIASLRDIRNADDRTFAHSVNVCVLCLTFGIHLGMDRVRLMNAGLAGLLHDVGKARISQAILNKEGLLDEAELEEIRRHPVYGHYAVRDGGFAPQVSWAVYQHHERLDGKGYPRALTGGEISPLARLVSLADIYDEMTAERVGRRAALPHEAVELIMAMRGTQFDPALAQAFVERVAIFPVGSHVVLNTGQVAVVVAQNRQLPTRPRLRIIRDATGVVVPDPLEIDLVEHPTIFVVWLCAGEG